MYFQISPSTHIAFPKLKFLELRSLNEWKEWDFGKEYDVTTMPQLKILKIRDCIRSKSVADQLSRLKLALQSWQVIKSLVFSSLQFFCYFLFFIILLNQNSLSYIYALLCNETNLRWEVCLLHTFLSLQL